MMTDSNDLPTILLVAGSKHTANSINRLLSGRFRTLHAENSAGGWDILQNGTAISVVICELASSLDENALLERIRWAESKIIAALPVLLLVGESDDEARLQNAYALGATDFISMPFSGGELKTRVLLHARLFDSLRNDADYEVAALSSSETLFNTLAQEKLFNSRLGQEISFSCRHKSFVSICLLQIEKADAIQDQYGNKVYKAVVRTVARLIEEQLRREDPYAFLGNATYALLYPVTNSLGANLATHRLMERIKSKHLKHDGKEIPVSLCAGLYSLMASETDTVEGVMKKLESRLEKAMQQGKGHIESSTTEKDQSVISISQALNKIQFNRAEDLAKDIPQLLEKLLPLLHYASANNESDLNAFLDRIDNT